MKVVKGMVHVSNVVGREFDLSVTDYNDLIEKGFKLNIISGEPVEIKHFNSAIYTSICGKDAKERNDVKFFGDEGIFKRDVMEAKRYKILPHLFFPDKEVTIWIDGNIYPVSDTDYMINRFLGDNDMAIFKHPYRENPYQEFDVLKKHERFQDPWLQEQLKEQKRFYTKEGLPKDFQLWECNFIIRRNNPRVNRLMEAWWAEICRWQWRDQVSLPYVVWKYGQGVRIATIQDGNIRTHKLFKYVDKYA